MGPNLSSYLSTVSVPDEYSAVIVRGKEEHGMFELESRR